MRMGALSIATLLFMTALSMSWASNASAYCASTTCVGACDRDADGCKTEGLPLTWASACVYVSLNAQASEQVSRDDFEQAAAGAVAAWSDVACQDGVASLHLELTNDVIGDVGYVVDGPNTNTIVFRDAEWLYPGLANTLAKSTITYDTETGEILDADLEINSAFNTITVSDTDVVYDLQSILTHEIGHWLGLDHSSDPNAAMSEPQEEGSTHRRMLTQDDIDGLCASYPPDRDADCAPEPDPELEGHDEHDDDEHGSNEDTVVTSGCGCRTVAKHTASGTDSGELAMWWLAALALALRIRSYRCADPSRRAARRTPLVRWRRRSRHE